MDPALLPEEAVLEFVRAQRWFGAKSSEVVGARLVDHAELQAGAPTLVDALFEIRYGAGTHDIYQLILGDGIGEPRIADGGYEAAGDPPFSRALVELIGRGAMLKAGDGTVEFCGMAD